MHTSPPGTLSLGRWLYFQLTVCSRYLPGYVLLFVCLFSRLLLEAVDISEKMLIRLDQLHVKSYPPFFVPLSSSSTSTLSPHLFLLVWKTPCCSLVLDKNQCQSHMESFRAKLRFGFDEKIQRSPDFAGNPVSYKRLLIL